MSGLCQLTVIEDVLLLLLLSIRWSNRDTNPRRRSKRQIRKTNNKHDNTELSPPRKERESTGIDDFRRWKFRRLGLSLVGLNSQSDFDSLFPRRGRVYGCQKARLFKSSACRTRAWSFKPLL